MGYLRILQLHVAEWTARQPFADDPPMVVTLGLAEETGEVCRAVLKMGQGIRGTREEWLAEVEKELGDVVIKACAVATSLGIDLLRAVEDRWEDVSQRDWTADRVGHGIDRGDL